MNLQFLYPISPVLHYTRKYKFIVHSNLPFSQNNTKYYKELNAAVNVVDKACRICLDVTSQTHFLFCFVIFLFIVIFLAFYDQHKFIVLSNVPLSKRTKYYKEFNSAVDVVDKACRICLDVKKSLLSSDGRIIEKNDQTPVTIADFGVQALISLELGKLFPSIPLVAEEDSAFLRANNLANSVLNVVSGKASVGDQKLTENEVLEAIDRGGKFYSSFGVKPATYWILDPIDGTRGFVKGGDAMYVVGLALIVEGEIVLGVMGCPNWKDDDPSKTSSGIIMIAHVGLGTWKKQSSYLLSNTTNNWTKCSVDTSCVVQKARFCSPDSQTWDSLPVSEFFDATTDAAEVSDKRIRLLSACCGSLCKYLMVASGRATVFIQRARSEKTIKAWDHAVGIICVQEAGGMVTDWRGSQLDFAVDQTERRLIYPSGGILVTNSTIHSQLLQLISASSSVVR